MPSLHSGLATLLPHPELIILCRTQWPLPRCCTLMSPVTAARDLLLELVSSVQSVQTTIFALPARPEGCTLSMCCCPSGTRCRWAAPWKVPYVWVCRSLWGTVFSCVAVVSTWKVDEVDETLHVESEPVSECEPGPGPGPGPGPWSDSSFYACCWEQCPLWLVSGPLVVLVTLTGVHTVQNWTTMLC